MPKRRANGEGNIRKRKDGRWEGRYTVGHDPETGKAIIKNVLGKTQAEVKEKLKKAIEENVGIDYGRAKTYTVGTWLEVWMENYAKVKLRPSTFKTSQGFLKNHIKPQIGSVPLADLTSLDLQRFYKHLLDGGRVDRIEAKKKPKGLAPKTVRNIHQMIGSAYNLAIEQHLVTKNPTQGCALPKVEHKEMKTLTADQLSAFFQEARDSGVYELYYLDLATANTLPLVIALRHLQGAVKHRRFTAEVRAELPHHLRSQNDLRHQNDGVFSQSQRLLYQTQVNLRLSAAGNAPQQRHRGFASQNSLQNFLISRLLFVVEQNLRPRLHILKGRHPQLLFLGKGNQSRLFHGLEGPGGRTGVIADSCRRVRPAAARKLTTSYRAGAERRLGSVRA